MCTVGQECLAEKLRRENIDQFNILVRMHLSFVLDLNTDENDAFSDKGKFKKWSLVPFKKSKLSRGPMEGAPLTQEGICQVYQLIEFLKKEPNINKEGVFRRTGSLQRQADLRNLLNQGMTLTLDGGPFSVHDCASVLKGFLAELPEPLLSEAHYPAYCQIAELCNVGAKQSQQEERLLQSLQLLLLLLPSENRVLLKDVLHLLNQTASYEPQNKMSADSLATLFTPHLLCPRKLSPESLHANSQTLSGIIAFMIRKSEQLFHIPPKLAVDIKAYLQERMRKKALSPDKMFDESVSDHFAANTVFSFVDHELTAKENQSNPTETALAQLYAHIQSLPESSKKRKLIKQFNKENGHGTPLQVVRSNIPKNKSLGDSIKKHIFHKGLMKSVKKGGFPLRSSSEELLSTPQSSTVRGRLFCGNCDTSDLSTDESAAKKPRKSIDEPEGTYLTSTPACVTFKDVHSVAFTPDEQDRKSMSPITRSTQRMCKAMQETMMTPRSRKPVLLVSGTNIAGLASENREQPKKTIIQMSNVSEEHSKDTTPLLRQTDSPNSLTSNFREYLYSRSLVTPTDLSFSSRTDDYSSTEIKDVTKEKMTDSLMNCLDGNDPSDEGGEKEWVLKPLQFDENGHPTIYETSF